MDGPSGLQTRGARGARNTHRASDDRPADPGTTTTNQVRFLTRGGEPVEIPGWTYVRLPDELIGGEIRPGHICNNPGFEVTAIDGDAWTTVETGVESAEGCGVEDHAVKDVVVNTLEGQLTVTQSGDRIEISHPSYRLALGRIQ